MTIYFLKDVVMGHGIIGLMFRRKINKLYSFPLGFDKSIHTFFCFCDMDAVCLDEYGFILKKLHMPAWKVFTCSNYTTRIVEGPVGAFDKYSIGDVIKF